MTGISISTGEGGGEGRGGEGGRGGGGRGEGGGGRRGRGRPFTMKFLHRNEEMAWERAQRSTFMNWANYHLKK